MSRIPVLLAAATVAVLVIPASAAEPPMNAFGIPIAPQSGKASIHQWGGLDDKFAVNPDGDEAPVRAPHESADAMAQSQDDANDPDDPDTDHEDDVIAI